MHRPDRTRADLRASIASAAARLMAEDGIVDYRQAKKKALSTAACLQLFAPS